MALEIASPTRRAEFSANGWSATELKLVLIFLLLYLDAGFVAYGVKIPSATSLLVIPLVGGLSRGFRIGLPVLGVFFAIGVVSLIASPASPQLEKVLSSWLQTALSIFLSICIFNWTSRLDSSRVGRAFGYVFGSMLILILLEFLGPLVGASSKFGETLYSNGVGFSYYGSGTYSLERDFMLAGFRRPTVFSPEPSIAAIGFSVAAIACVVTHRSGKWLTAACISLLASWYVFRSPIPIAAALVCVFLSVPHKSAELKRFLRAAALVAVAIVGALLASNRLVALISESERFATSSEGIRLALPLINTFNSLARGYWLGTGPGAQYDQDFIASLNEFHTPQFGTNGLLLAVFYYGPLMFAVIVFLYYRAVSPRSRGRRLGVPMALFALILGASLGAIESPRLLGFLAVLTGCMASAQDSDTGRARRRNDEYRLRN